MEDQAKQIELKVTEPETPSEIIAPKAPESDAPAPNAIDPAALHGFTHNAGVAKKCASNWDEMKGSDCVRKCELCGLNVVDLDSDNQAGADLSWLKAAKLFRRADGRYVDGDCQNLRLPYNRKYVTAAFIIGSLIASLGWGMRYFVFFGDQAWAPFTSITMSLLIFWYGTGLMLLLRHKSKWLITILFLLPVPFGNYFLYGLWPVLKPLLFVPLVVWMKKLGIAPLNQGDPMTGFYPMMAWVLCLTLIFVVPGMRFLRAAPPKRRLPSG